MQSHIACSSALLHSLLFDSHLCSSTLRHVHLRDNLNTIPYRTRHRSQSRGVAALMHAALFDLVSQHLAPLSLSPTSLHASTCRWAPHLIRRALPSWRSACHRQPRRRRAAAAARARGAPPAPPRARPRAPPRARTPRCACAARCWGRDAAGRLVRAGGGCASVASLCCPPAKSARGAEWSARLKEQRRGSERSVGAEARQACVNQCMRASRS